MIRIQLPDSGPLYLALWRSRQRDESIQAAALRALKERFETRAAVPGKTLLSYVEVIENVEPQK